MTIKKSEKLLESIDSLKSRLDDEVKVFLEYFFEIYPDLR